MRVNVGFILYPVSGVVSAGALNEFKLYFTAH